METNEKRPAREHRLNLRLVREEFETWQLAATARHMTLSEWMRLHLNDAARRDAPPSPRGRKR